MLHATAKNLNVSKNIVIVLEMDLCYVDQIVKK
jgi:hypothetical protein